MDGGGEAFAAAVQVGADGVDGEVERGGNALVAEIFPVAEDEHGAFGFREGEQGGFHGGLGFVVAADLFGGTGVFSGKGAGRLVFEPGIRVVFARKGWNRGKVFAVAAATLPLVLGDVVGDAIEEGGEVGVAAEVGEGAEEAEEDLLGEVFDVGAGAGEAVEGAEDEGLVLADELLEAFRGCVVTAHGWNRV